MDCEKFDEVVIDALEGDLDALTLAAVKRHTDGCARCRTAWSGLRATQRVGLLPLVEAPAGLEERILLVAQEAHRRVSWPRRIGRAVSWAGSYAMRPQTAMAALLLLMIGSSLLFLRARPDRAGSPSRVSVTERGVPEHAGDDPGTPAERLPQTDTRPSAQSHGARRDEVAAAADSAKSAAGEKSKLAYGDIPAPPPAAAASAYGGSAEAPKAVGRADDDTRGTTDGLMNAAAPAGAPMPATAAPQDDQAKEKGGTAAGDGYAGAMALYNAGRFAEAARGFDAVAAADPANAMAALFAAKSVEASAGCRGATPRYESIAARFAGTAAATEALRAAAGCYQHLGNEPGQAAGPAAIAQQDQPAPARQSQKRAAPSKPAAAAKKAAPVNAAGY